MSVRNSVGGHRTGVVFGVLIVLSVLLLSLSSNRGSFRVKTAGLSVVSTFQGAFKSTADFLSSTVTSVRELGRLRSDYSALLERVRHYEGMESDIAELQHEVSQLREILGFSQALQYRNVPAQIIGKDPGNLFSTITIDKGRLDGMRQNMPVVAVQDGEPGLVGKIYSVGRRSSQVLPIFDTGNYVAARLQDSRYEGLVSGQGTGHRSVTMRYVNAQARNEIQYGDLVITSGMNSIYPKGIHIGVVESIQARPYETSLELTVRPIVDFSRMEYLFVIVTED